MELGRRDLLLGLAATGAAATAQTAPPGKRLAGDPGETIDLWPAGAPGMPATPPVETVDERSSDPALPDRAVHGVARPRMVVFRPARPNGAAVLIAPGGGYARIVIDKEGYEVARWLAARGVTVFVLFYRLPGDGWAAGADVALADAQRAMRLIRYHARDYGIDPARLAMMGFSAGGHVCGDLATRFDATVYRPVDAADGSSARPMLAAPIYAVQSMSMPLAHPGSRTLLIGKDASPAMERAHSTAANVTARAPPMFLVHAEDDATVPIDNTLEMRAALRRAGVAVETHLFAEGGHGFGLRRAAGKPAAIWPTLFLDWASAMGLA
jgi:acetyl esterase/lipase